MTRNDYVALRKAGTGQAGDVAARAAADADADAGTSHEPRCVIAQHGFDRSMTTLTDNRFDRQLCATGSSRLHT